MKKVILWVFLLISGLTFAQVGVGTENPESSAMFQVESSNKGVLITRVTLSGTNDTTTIAIPTEGLLIYNTATASFGDTAVSPGFYYFNGTEWKRLLNSGNVVSNTASITANTLAISNLPGAVFTGNTTVASNIYTTTQDFVFGSSSLDDVSGDSDDARFFFDKSKAAFRAGLGYRSDWDEGNIGDYSIVLGDGLASGRGAMAFGGSNTVTANSAIAVGGFNVVKGDNSKAIGFGLQTNSFSELVVGSYNIELDPDEIEIDTWQELDPLFTVGNGSSYSNKSNAFQILKNGDATFYDTLTVKKDLDVEGGIDVTGTITATTFVGDGSRLTGLEESIFTGNASLTSNVYSATQDFIFGSNTTDDLSGTYDDARFYFLKAKAAFGAGYFPSLVSENGFLSSYDITDFDPYDVGDYSINLGNSNEASDLGAIAIGILNTTRAYGAKAMGDYLMANSSSEIVIGSYNEYSEDSERIVWKPLDPLFTVGNGDFNSDNKKRSNAFRILKNGDATFYDNLTVKKDLDVEGGIDVTGTISATAFVGDGSRLTGTVTDGSITNSKISSSAAIDFTKLNISKTNIVGLGIPSEDTNTTYSAGEGLRLDGTSFSVNSNVVTSTYTGDVGITGTVSATAFVGDGSRLTGISGGSSVFTGNASITSNVYTATQDFVFGSSSLDDISGSSDDVRFFFDKSKGAFRAGKSTNTAWNNNNIGNNSIALGFNTIASESYSIAIGLNTQASGNTSIAMGYLSQASGPVATAMGENTKAFGGYSTAMGVATQASGDYSTAMGAYTQASGKYSIATGYQTKASGAFSTSLGYATEASGESSTAMGYSTKAFGAFSTAMGYNTKASGMNSTAMGSGTQAMGETSTAMGIGTQAQSVFEVVIGSHNELISGVSSNTWEQTDPLFTVGNGRNELYKSNAFQILKNGDATFYEDLEVKGTLTESSDIRLKKNIANISNATETINKLSPKRYRKKTKLTSEEYSIEEMGFIAQDIEKILPFLVTKGNSVDEILSLDYTSFIALLTKGFQEQSAKMEAQTTKLNQLEERLKRIEKLLNENQP